MCDDDTKNLYGWWPMTRKPPVVIFSCAGFDLPASDPKTNRALANVTVSGLAGFFGGMDSHKRGPKDCPLFYDEDRDVDVLSGRQKFDGTCRAKLKKAIPKDLPALEAILKAFS